MECLVGWDPKTQTCESGIFGEVEAYGLAVEEQARYTLHAHMILWIKNFSYIRRLLFSRDQGVRTAARKEYLSYIRRVLCASHGKDLVLEHSGCKHDQTVTLSVDDLTCDNEVLRRTRHKDHCSQIEGKVFGCPHCNVTFSSNDVLNMSYQNVISTAGSSVELPLSNERTQIASIRYPYDILLEGQENTTEDPLWKSESARLCMLNSTENEHDSSHRPGCFKGGKMECRHFLPKKDSDNFELYEDLGEDNKNVLTVHHLDGTTSETAPYSVIAERHMGSQFLNEHSPVLTEVFGANSNLQVGNPAHLFYNTLYTSKNSQNEDQSRYNVIATSIIRRIVRLHQDARIQQDGSQDQADYLEGLCRFLSGMTAAMSKDIVSSTLAHWLLTHDGSRFMFSHGFQEVPLGQMVDTLMGKDVRTYRVRTNYSQLQGKSVTWGDSASNDYIHRPNELDCLCLYELTMKWAVSFKKFKEMNNNSGDEEQQGQQEPADTSTVIELYAADDDDDSASHTDNIDNNEEDEVELPDILSLSEGHPGSEFASMKRRPLYVIPRVSIPDKELCRIRDLKIGDAHPTPDVIDNREAYARNALLLFYPFREHEDIKLNGSYWAKFQEALDKKTLWERGVRILENIDERRGVQCLARASDPLTRETSEPESDPNNVTTQCNGDDGGGGRGIDLSSFDFEIGMDGQDDGLNYSALGGTSCNTHDVKTKQRSHLRDVYFLEPKGTTTHASGSTPFLLRSSITGTAQEQEGSSTQGTDTTASASTSSSDSNGTTDNGNSNSNGTGTTTSTSSNSTCTRLQIQRQNFPTFIMLVSCSQKGRDYSSIEEMYNGTMTVPANPPGSADIANCGFNPSLVPTLQGVARQIAKNDGIKLDQKQYIGYEIIACTFLIYLIRSGVESFGGPFSEDAPGEVSNTEENKDHLLQSLRARGGKDQLRMFLTGFAGAGKSTAITVAKEFCRRFCVALGLPWSEKSFYFTSTTGVSAALFGGETIHMAAYLNHKKITEDMKSAWQHVVVLVVDEISFFSLNNLKKLNKCLQTIKGTGSNVTFGGVSVVFVGDFHQLDPVGCKESEVLYNGATNGLWEGSINVALFLEHSHRFDGDPIFGEILKRLWRGELTRDDIRTINTRLVGPENPLPSEMSGDLSYACPTNRERNIIEWGLYAKKIKSLCPPTDNHTPAPDDMLIIQADIQSTNSAKSKGRIKVSKRLKELILSTCGDDDVIAGSDKGGRGGTKIDPSLRLSPGCSGMGISNKDLRSKGVGNGTTFTVVGVKLKPGAVVEVATWDGRKVNTVSVLWVEHLDCMLSKPKALKILEEELRKLKSELTSNTDPGTAGELRKALSETERAIAESTDKLRFQLKPRSFTAEARVSIDPNSDSKTTIKGIKITQLPMNLNDATTGHKLQVRKGMCILYMLMRSAPQLSILSFIFCYLGLHNKQGCSKDRLIIAKFTKRFKNWIYVVLSRVRTLKGLYLLDTLDEDDDTLGEVPRALRMHEQRLKTLERTVLAQRAAALSRLNEQEGT